MRLVLFKGNKDSGNGCIQVDIAVFVCDDLISPEKVELVLSSRGDQRTIGPEWERVKSGYIVLVLDLHSPCLCMFVSRRHDHAWSLPTARDQRRLLQILFVCSLMQITSPSLY